jgi:hypothetical protein
MGPREIGMAWEKRESGQFFYTSRRVGKHVVKTYWGHGTVAQIASELSQKKKTLREAARESLSRTKILLKTPQQTTKVLQIVCAAAQSAWRRAQEPEISVMDDAADPLPEVIAARIGQIWSGLEAGDPAVQPELRALLDEYPTLVPHFGDVGAHALHSWIELFGGDRDDPHRRGIDAKLSQLAQELDENVTDVASRLLRDRVLVTWLQVAYLDARLAGSVKAGDCLQPYLGKVQKEAARQHLAVLKAWSAHTRHRRPARAKSEPVSPAVSTRKRSRIK